jgi:hyperosmotically inducible periplasmic protein
MNILSFRKTLIAVGVATALGISVGALAQSTESSQPGAHSETAGMTTVDTGSSVATATPEGIQPANTYLSSDLIGANVEQPGDQDQAATLRQLVVDATGSVTHVILGYGGIVGVGEKAFIVPFSALSFTETDGELAVYTSLLAEEVQAMPEFRTQEQASADAETAADTAVMNTESATASQSVGETISETSESVGETVSEATESVGAAVGDAVTETQRVTSDSWITTKVKSMIYADSLSQGYEVSVKTLHGAVALTGTLENQAAIDHVKLIAAEVKGVKSVDTSNLTVQ